ncbi:MAG: hypothetical protein HQK53_18615 [Oligoflexia bacterium]|nr:hypothetical protein [Oligoflexia bacterium]
MIFIEEEDSEWDEFTMKVFIIKSEPEEKSPFDVSGVNLNISAEEILQFIQEGRKY